MKKIPVALLLAVSILFVSFLLALWNPLQVIQWKISDTFFRPGAVADSITIIAIDEKSLSKEASLGRFKDWPRTYYSQILRAINAHKPTVVAFDLDFREASRGMSDLRIAQLLKDYEKRVSETQGSPIGYDWYGFLKRFQLKEGHPDDVDLQNAIRKSGKIILTSKLTSSQGVDSVAAPDISGVIKPVFSGENVSLGFTNMFPDRDSVIRRFLPSAGEFESFGLAVAKAFLSNSANSQALQSNLQIPIRYTGKPFSYRTISFADVLAGQYRKEDIQGKIVLVGATDPTIQDLHRTPTSSLLMPGVALHANIVQQILEGRLLSEQKLWSVAIFIFILTIFGSFLFLRLRLLYAGIIFMAVLIALPAVAFAMYQKGIVLNAVYPEISWIVTVISVLIYRNQTEFREKRQIKKAFAHYVSPVVVDELARDPDSLKLGGKREKLSVMFSDIVGFTTLAEKLSPEDTVALLNDYLTAMTEVIFGYHGTLDKYQGDAIMALFGAPFADVHHALSACYTSLGMRRSLVALHEKWNSIPALPFKDELVQLDFRVGIATGAAVIGNVGSEKRFDYTAIGDIVNLGSRLESINRKYGTRVIVDKNTFTAVTENHNPFIFRKIDIVRVKGKKIETEIFELVALQENVTSEAKSMLDDFENGRMLYTERNFKDAVSYFESALSKIPEDGPSRIYLNRCNFFIRKPPNRDWNAVVDLEEK